MTISMLSLGVLWSLIRPGLGAIEVGAVSLGSMGAFSAAGLAVAGLLPVAGRATIALTVLLLGASPVALTSYRGGASAQWSGPERRPLRI